MSKYIADSYLYRAIGADINGGCGKCVQSRSDCMCHSLSRMDICGIIDDAPPADVQEVKRGRWIDPEDLTCYKCSVCGEYATQEYGLTEPIFWHYCPSCGAKMDEVTE